MFEMYINDVPKDQQISTITTLEKNIKVILKNGQTIFIIKVF